MAEGVTVESQLGNIWLHDECLKYGFQYTLVFISYYLVINVGLIPILPQTNK